MQNANASSYYVKQSENEVTNKRLLYTKKKVVYELLYVGPHLKFLLIYTHIKQWILWHDNVSKYQFKVRN